MFKQIIEYREMQQLRKDHLMKQRQRMMFIIIPVLCVVLLASYIVDAVKPSEPVKAATTSQSTQEVPTMSDSVKQQELSNIEEFAYMVTHPVDEMQSGDLDLLDDKANDPCYEKNAQLPEEEMVVAITACKFPK